MIRCLIISFLFTASAPVHAQTGAEVMSLIKILGALKALSAPNQSTGSTEQTTPDHQQVPPTLAQSNVASLGDLSETLLRCFHRTGNFRGTSVMQVPWVGGQQYNATHSLVIRVTWQGSLTSNVYFTDFALMERDNMLKAIVLAENSLIGASTISTPRRL